MVSDECMSSGLEFKSELGGWLFSACWVISGSFCFVVVFVGMVGSISLSRDY